MATTIVSRRPRAARSLHPPRARSEAPTRGPSRHLSGHTVHAQHRCDGDARRPRCQSSRAPQRGTRNQSASASGSGLHPHNRPLSTPQNRTSSCCWSGTWTWGCCRCLRNWHRNPHWATHSGCASPYRLSGRCPACYLPHAAGNRITVACGRRCTSSTCRNAVSYIVILAASSLARFVDRSRWGLSRSVDASWRPPSVSPNEEPLISIHGLEHRSNASLQ
jgi:hypothetical protein